MSGQNKHIYTSEDIRRYHSGAMSQAEMHAMEKSALEDPFLADALEGYVHSHDMTSELQSLRNRLAEKTDSKVVAMPVRRRNFGWMRIAALFIVLAAAGWVIFRMNMSSGEQQAIQQAPATSITDTKSADVAAGNTPQADTTTEETYVPVIKEPTIAAASPSRMKSSSSRPAPAGTTALPGTYDLADIADAYERNDSAVLLNNASTVSTETIAAQKAPAGNYGFVAPRMNTINGVVIDEKSNAIPFASVIAKNHTGTLTDNNGRFQLSVPDTMSVVGVNAPGYESRNINLKEAKDDAQIVLRESADETKEVVLARSRSAYNAKRNQNVKQAIVEIGELEPEGGWSEYNSYIAEKITPPKTYKKTSPAGVVELSFDVDENGNPVNITVEKSLCASCDKEAIRLLKEGPKWKKQEGKGKITIRF